MESEQTTTEPETILDQIRHKMRPNIDADLSLPCMEVYTTEKRDKLIQIATIIVKTALNARTSSIKEKIPSNIKKIYERHSYNNLDLIRDLFVDSIAILNPHIEPLSALIYKYITNYENELKTMIFDEELPKRISNAFKSDHYGNLKAYLHFISCFVTYGLITSSSYVSLLNNLADQIPNVSISRKEAIARVIAFSCKTCSTEVEEDEIEEILNKVGEYINNRENEGYFNVLNPLKDSEVQTSVDTLYNSSRQDNLLSLFDALIERNSSDNQSDFPDVEFEPPEEDKSSYPIFFLPFRDTLSPDRTILQELASDLILFCGNDWQLLKDQLMILPLVLEYDENNSFSFKDTNSLLNDFPEQARDYICILINAAISDVCRIPTGYKEMTTNCHVLNSILTYISGNSNDSNKEIFKETVENYFTFIAQELAEKLTYVSFSRLVEFFSMLLSLYTVRDDYLTLFSVDYWKRLIQDVSSTKYGMLFVREILRSLSRTNSEIQIKRILLSQEPTWDAVFPQFYFEVIKSENVATEEKYAPNVAEFTTCLNEKRETFESVFSSLEAKTGEFNASYSFILSIIELGLAEENVSGYFDSIKNYILKYTDEIKKVFNDETIGKRLFPFLDPIVQKLKPNHFRPVLIQTLLFLITQKIMKPSYLLDWLFSRLPSIDEQLKSEADDEREVEQLGEFINLFELYYYIFVCVINEFINPRRKSNLDVDSAINIYSDFLIKAVEQYSVLIEDRFSDYPEIEWAYIGFVTKTALSHFDVFNLTCNPEFLSKLPDNKIKELLTNLVSLNKSEN